MKSGLLTYLAKLKYLAKVPYQIYLSLFIVASITCIIALRHNNQTMIKLRSDVYSADQANTNIEGALDKLRAYVYAHMNTNLSSGGNTIKPPIQLKYTYERLVTAAQAAANNSGLYTDAENYCQAQIPASVSVSGRGRIDCVQNYILSHGGTAPATIPAGLYEFDFANPSWSPDLAGWSLVATGALGLATAGSFLYQRYRK